MLDRSDQLGDGRLARLDVEVRHPIDRRAVPVLCTRVRHARQAAAFLRHRAAEAADQDAVLDQVLTLSRCAVVVEAVRRQLAGHGGIERDVQQLGAVLVGAEHVGRDEARAGVVALVAEDPVEFERVADRLMDLQDHLVGCEQRIHHAGRAVGGGEQLERLVGDARRSVAEAVPTEHLGATLAAERVTAKRAGLGVRALVCGCVEAGIHEAEALLDASRVAVARGGQQQLVDVTAHQRRAPVDDAVVDTEQARLLLEQFEAVVQRQRVPRDLDR